MDGGGCTQGTEPVLDIQRLKTVVQAKQKFLGLFLGVTLSQESLDCLLKISLLHVRPAPFQLGDTGQEAIQLGARQVVHGVGGHGLELCREYGKQLLDVPLK
eukprot:12931137-Prorocentrum_lima.AAC.1